jgi:hypothetical protein
LSEGKEQAARPPGERGGRSIVPRENVLLALSAAALGLAGASIFAAYRAVSADGEDSAGRIAEFAANAAWPGVLIFAAIAAVVWFGWKANLD